MCGFLVGGGEHNLLVPILASSARIVLLCQIEVTLSMVMIAERVATGASCRGGVASGLFYPCCRISVPPLAAGTAMAASSTLGLCSSLTLRNFRPKFRVD